jgi:hypothetical protein
MASNKSKETSKEAEKVAPSKIILAVVDENYEYVLMTKHESGKIGFIIGEYADSDPNVLEPAYEMADVLEFERDDLRLSLIGEVEIGNERGLLVMGVLKDSGEYDIREHDYWQFITTQASDESQFAPGTNNIKIEVGQALEKIIAWNSMKRVQGVQPFFPCFTRRGFGE